MAESNITSLDVDGEGVCAEFSVHGDQVPAVGQQTEVGEESEYDGEEDVVSSLTGCKSESCITGSEASSASNRQKVDDGCTTGTWYLYAHSTANAETRVSPDSEMHPDSVQQEEAVTTSSESAIRSTHKHTDCTDTDPVNGSGVNDITTDTVWSLVNYDSSDSDESSVKTPRIENLDEGSGSTFQFPDSNSQSLESKNTEADNQPGDDSGKQSETVEESQEDKKDDGNDGYWNSEGYWVDSQGRYWQPQGNDAYWQGEHWNQEQENHGETWQGYASNPGQGYTGQEQQWPGQGGEEIEPKKEKEQLWFGEGAHRQTQPIFEGDASFSSGDQYNSREYYQQQYGKQQYGGNSGEQQYYDQTAYYSHEDYASGDSQQPSKSDVNTAQQSHVYCGTSGQPDEPSPLRSTYPQPLDHSQLQTGSNSNQGQTQYGNQRQCQPDQETFYCHQPDPTPAWDHRQQQQQPQPQHMQRYGQQHEPTYRQHSPSQDGADKCGGRYLYTEQPSQSGDGPQPVGQQNVYNSQACRPDEQAQYRQNQPYNQHERDWNNHQWSGHSQSWQHNQYDAGGWDVNRGRGSDCASHYQPSEQSQQQQITNRVEQGYEHHQYYNDHHNSTYNNPPPTASPASSCAQPSIPISPNHPPPLPTYPPPNIPPPPPHPHPPPPVQPPHPSSHPPIPLPPPLSPRSPHSLPPPPSHSPFAPPPPVQSSHTMPHNPSLSSPQSYHSSGDYMQSPTSLSSWQHSRDSVPHSDTHWRRWKYREDAPQVHGSHPRMPSPPTSSDVSSTSRESPTPIQQSTATASSPEHHESSRSPSKTVFSQQLLDPRRSSPPASLKDRSSGKHSNTVSTLIQRRTGLPKQPTDTVPSSPASCSESRHGKVAATVNKATNSKASSGEPVSFPKSSLSGFRIPKHSKASHTKKLQNESCTTAVNMSLKKQDQPPSRERVRSVTVTSVEKQQQAASSQEESIEGRDSATSELLDSVPKSDDDSTKTTEQDFAIPCQADKYADSATDASQLISLFKSIDSNTLCALASTIKLALGSSTGRDLAVDDKVPSPSTTTTVETIKCDNALTNKQQRTPTCTDKEESTSGTGMNHATSASVTAEESSNDKKLQETQLTDTSTTAVDVAKEPGDAGQLQDAAEGTKVGKPSQANPRAGSARMVIATVLSTSATTQPHPPAGIAIPPCPSEAIAAPSHLQASIATPSFPSVNATTSKPEESASEPEASTEGVKLQRDALTVCIPIRKEVKLQVKSDPDISKVVTHPKEEEVKGLGSEAVPINVASDPERQDTKQQQVEKEESTKDTESMEVKTISLLKAQDLMFDPKYMYKEYNLRRVRKPESSPEQSPQKRQKLDTPQNKMPNSDKERGRSKSEDTDKSISSLPTSDKGKRKASAECKEQSVENAVPKKPRTDTDTNIAAVQDKPDNQTVKRQLNFSVSIPHVQRSLSPALPPFTLTQLLSTTKAMEEPPNIEDEKSRVHVAQDSSKLKDKFKKKLPTNCKLPLDTGGALGTRPLSTSRSQLLCSLCKQKGGVSCLGFLFGPYVYCPGVDSSSNSNTYGSNDTVEVWLHEDCCVWAPGVCLVGRELKGLREALTDADKMICTVCKRAGATLCCASRGCKNTYHFPCALEKGCVLNEDQFQTNCPRHKDHTCTG